MNVNEIREMYPEGTQIVLTEMRGENQMPYGLKGTVKFVDDAGQIHMKWENGSSLALNINEDTFEKVEAPQKISVILVEPGRYPKLIEIEDTLEAMQSLVEGDIEEYMLFDDEVAIICNEEGKMRRLLLIRTVYEDNKEMVDIIASKFFICYALIESEKFLSMPRELARKYGEKFKYPKRIYQIIDGIEAKPYKLVSKDMKR